MKTHDLHDLVKSHLFFRNLSDEHIQLICGCARNVHFSADEIIAKEGESANYFYILRQGIVAVELRLSDNNVRTLQTLHDGDVFGWSWLFPPYRWTFEAKALTDVRTTAFDGKCLRDKCEQDYELGYKLIKQFAQTITSRLTAARLQHLDIYKN